MKVKLLAKAVRDLNEIATFIAADNPRSAQRVTESLADALDLISKNLEIGRIAKGQTLRLFVVPRLPYVMPYRLRLESIEILRVFHTSRLRPSNGS